MGVTVTRADFYSEVPTIRELEDSFSKPSRLRLDGAFQDAAFLRAYLNELIEYSQDFQPEAKSTQADVYAWDGGALGNSDAMSYYAMIRRVRPRTIVELGCGASTLIAKLACERNGFGRVIGVDPHPPDYLSVRPRSC